MALIGFRAYYGIHLSLIFETCCTFNWLLHVGYFVTNIWQACYVQPHIKASFMIVYLSHTKALMCLSLLVVYRSSRYCITTT